MTAVAAGHFVAGAPCATLGEAGRLPSNFPETVKEDEDSLYSSDAQPVPKGLRPTPSKKPALHEITELEEEQRAPRAAGNTARRLDRLPSPPPTPRSSHHEEWSDEDQDLPPKKKKVDANYWKFLSSYMRFA